MAALFAALYCTVVYAQPKGAAAAGSEYNQKLYSSLQWRSIGPARGGRSAAVTGVPGKPALYYFGATGGGVWRTKDGGNNWQNLSDGYFGGSIGAVAVSEADPNVLYVGGGEKTIRGNVSSGYGIWKSEDAGASWKQSGLTQSRHISRIRIHPKNPDLAYAAVMGDAYKSHPERGVFRTKDGGKTWQPILQVNADVGAVDLILDPANPRILYATTWRFRRTPHSFLSGGEGSGIWKSTDGGDTWKNLSENEGFPKAPLGIIGVAVSPANPQRVWAMTEAKEGGLFRSDDGGKTWKKINDDRSLRQRAWYYTRVYAHPKNPDVVYVLNVGFHKSQDGGKTFTAIDTPHGDHHDLWIAPDDPDRMIIADDGGAQVSFDGGIKWSTYLNQPTAQFYRVTTDTHFPYRIYAAQQDNSTIRIPHRTAGWFITDRDWEETAGGESAHIAPDPLNPDVVYAGSYDGYLTRLDHQTRQERAINVWPDNPMGHGAEGMKYRFQWNFPIFFSPHNPKKLYTCSNHLHVTYNEGQSWEIISPDLTRNDPAKLGASGGPITKDNTSVEYYCTIFAAAESPIEKDLIWTGSDDGLVHLTQNGGKDWQNVTPKNLPEWTMINSIEPDPHQKGSMYFAATRYKMGDYAPYLFKTKDYGKTWTKITKGIADEHFTRVLRADPARPGLLYCGTETGMYISFDDGANWQPFQLNLPIVPITDLAVRDNNLIAATQGRSLWIIDDLTPLHQLSKEVANADFYLYQPMPTYRFTGVGAGEGNYSGENRQNGVMIHYYLKNKPDSAANISLEILENDTLVIRKFSNKAKENRDKINPKDSANLFIWNMKYPNAKGFDGMILWWANLSGPTALPGKYKVRLTVNDKAQTQDFVILKDPRSTASPNDMQQQFTFVKEVCDKLTQVHQTIATIRDVRKQLSDYKERIKADDKLKDLLTQANTIDSLMTTVEETLYQTKNRSGQDPLNFPIRLNNKLAHLNALIYADYPPTNQAIAVKNELTQAIDAQLAIAKTIFEQQIPQFNQMIRDKAVDVILLKQEEKK
ncbi:MAG TPA: hypothetical protein PK239_07860 [Chitinophagales bacterium]|nr:hypothetical protein [Chitinophagales bacterium]